MRPAPAFDTARAPAIAAQGGPRIGVFDSGVGGLSVLRALRAALPSVAWRYVADSAHAPYGERDDAFVARRSLDIAQRLLDEGCVGLVVACNTATAMAVDALRARWPTRPIVGVEPGVKPAVARSLTRRIGVMATPATLASERYRALVATLPPDVTLVDKPCPDLAWLIEQGAAAAAERRAAVLRHCAGLRGEAVDTVVLGCTHYAFVHDEIARAMGPGVAIVDTADAVARQAARRFGSLQPAPQGGAPGRIRLSTTGDPQALRAFASAWLAFDFDVDAASLGSASA